MLIAAVTIPLALAVSTTFARLYGGDSARALRILRYALATEFIILLILCAVGLVYEHRARAHDASLFPEDSRLIDVGGHRMHLNCSGTAGNSPTVVLEYGLEGSYLDWYRVQPEVARFARVCSYDRAGYGWSERSPRDRIPSVMAEELHALLQAAGEKPPYVIIAHSYGSAIGEMFAHKYPGEIAGLVLVDGVHLRSSVHFALGHRTWLLLMQWAAPFGLPRWRHWCGGGPPELRAQAEAAYCRPSVFAAYYREWAQLPESAADLSAITTLGDIPLVVISRDPKLGRNPEEEEQHAQQQRALLQLSSNANLIVAEGSGHDIPGQRPDVIVEAVRTLPKPRGPAGTPGTP